MSERAPDAERLAGAGDGEAAPVCDTAREPRAVAVAVACADAVAAAVAERVMRAL